MSSKHDKPIALVMDEYINGLGLVRSLGKDPTVPIWALIWNGSMVGSSRYVDKVIWYTDREDFDKKLIEINNIGRKVVPYFAKDVNFLRLNQLKDQLPNFVIEYHDVEILDKNYQTQFAMDSGITIPPSKRINSKEDYFKIKELPLPIIVKPSQHNDEGKSAFKAIITDDLKEVERLCERCFENRQTAIIAEYIPGGDDSLYTFGGYAYKGKLIEVFHGRKLVQKPRSTGTATTAESLPGLNLEPMCKQFIKDTEYTGIFQLEFKKSTKNGKYYFIEFNPRNWLWSYCATVSGANLPLAKYYTESETKVYERTPSIKKTSIHGIEGLLFNLFRDKWPGAIWITIKAMLRAKRHSFFKYKWNDLKPIMKWLHNTFLNLIGKRKNRR